MNKLAIIATFFGLAPGMISCNHPANSSNSSNPSIPSVSVNVTEVTKEKITLYDAYPATVVALKEVELRSEVNGFITGIYFDDAQPVIKDQKLYEIDRIKYQASYQQAKDNVEIAQADLERKERDANRYTDLNKQDAVAKQKYEDAITDLNNAKLQVASAKAELTKTETDLNYSIIKAPFDGTIGISMVKMGALINAGQTLLNIISSDDPMGVDFVIDEKELSRFQLLEKKMVVKVDSTFHLILPDNSIYPLSGKISLIDRAVDPQTGTIKVRLIYPNQKGMLKSGMNCNVQVLNDNDGSQLVIPFKAVVEQMGEFFVFVSDGKQVKQTKIMLGPKIGSKVIVRQGLKQGDQVVTDGVQKLRDGSFITVGVSGAPHNS
jgi:membrane fusion protein, multidrug efflux system